MLFIQIMTLKSQLSLINIENVTKSILPDLL